MLEFWRSAAMASRSLNLISGSRCRTRAITRRRFVLNCPATTALPSSRVW